MTRSYVPLVIFVALAFQPGIAQITQQTKENPCPSAWVITHENAGKGNVGDAWTTPASNRGGVLSLTYCWVFQNGPTTLSRIPLSKLAELPAGLGRHIAYGQRIAEQIKIGRLPPGFTIYEDMAFEIRTQAVHSQSEIAIRVPSIQNEEEFKKLHVLYLDEDFMLPGSIRWHASREEKLDFNTKTISADFHYASVFHHDTYTGRVIVASFNQAEFDKTRVDVGVAKVIGPPVVRSGETFSYTITVNNGKASHIAATDVVLNSNRWPLNVRFVSATSTQGRCRKSVNSDSVTVCELGTIGAGKSAVITITAKVEEKRPYDDNRETVFVTDTLILAREKDNNFDNNSYRSGGTTIRP